MRVALLALALGVAVPPQARADWLFTPFIGTAFGAETAFLDLDPGGVSSQHWLIGGAAGWLGDGILGVEGEVAYLPNFFEGDKSLSLVVGSHVTTLSGSVLMAMPLAVTRESLRPYLLAGLAHLHVNLEDVIGFARIASDSAALQLGGGAFGFVSDRAGVRFDLRHVRSLRRATDVLRGDRRTQLSFWRATVGVTVRY